MQMFDVNFVKSIHVGCAILSFSGFFLRGIWMLRESPRLKLRSTKTIPHIVDATLLASAITVAVSWSISPLQHNWLMAKIVALILYIGLGMVALRFGSTKPVRRTAWLLGLATISYIATVAYTKSPLGALVYLFS